MKPNENIELRVLETGVIRDERMGRPLLKGMLLKAGRAEAEFLCREGLCEPVRAFGERAVRAFGGRSVQTFGEQAAVRF